LKKYNFKLANDLYYELATGKIDPLDIKSIFTEKPERESVVRKIEDLLPKEEADEVVVEDRDDYLIIDNDLKNVNYNLAKCCNPVFGDPVFGFVTINNGIKIHRNNCPNARRLKEKYPYRVIRAKWKETYSHGAFLTTLHIIGAEESAITSEISRIIAKDTGAHLRSLNIDADKGKFDGTLKLTVYNTDHLDFLIHKMKKVKGIISVTRGEK